MKLIGKRIKDEREARNLSQDELAKLAGVSRGRISQIENEPDPKTDAITLLKLAQYFRVNPYWFAQEGADKNGGAPEASAPPEFSEMTRIAAQRFESLEEAAKMHLLRLMEYIQTISNPNYWTWSEKERQAAHRRREIKTKKEA